MKAQHLIVMLAIALTFAERSCLLGSLSAANKIPLIAIPLVEQVRTHAEKTNHNLFDFDGYSRRVEINASVTPRNIFGSSKA